MPGDNSVIVALSGGVDSAVAALRLAEAGFAVECLHMTNWTDDDGYCQAAADYHDARRTADKLGLPLHRADFSSEYRADVFEEFVAAHRRGETPNPDVLCNRRIKFGVMQRYARRLGGRWLATGHYADIDRSTEAPLLMRGRDRSKDQTYFLHAVRSDAFAAVLFPLGGLTKTQVREQARRAGLGVAGKRDSTGICFIGERPFTDFLGRFVAHDPGPIVSADGADLGTHRGLAFYTLGQRQGLEIGGRRGFSGDAWYVAAKKPETNTLVAVQGANHPLLFQDRLVARDINWIGPPPDVLVRGDRVRLSAKTRYRQPDLPCTVAPADAGSLVVDFDEPQRAVTPGQYVVLYSGNRCLGGGRIVSAHSSTSALRHAV